MVKQAFLDNELTKKRPLSSANSINIARLIPQSFYYFEAYKQLKHHQKDLVFSVPSGNFGNLCAGILAKKMGLPIAQLIAATNANSIVPEYLHSGVFAPRASVPTISNAMDVGNPSNFERIQTLMGSHAAATQHIAGYHFTDAQTTAAIAQIYQQYDYIACPHTAVGYLGWEAYTQNHPKNAQNQLGVVLATAHPAKFVEVMPVHIAQAVQLPASLQNIMQKTKKSVVLPPTFDALKSFLM
jgi:threonine synthase